MEDESTISGDSDFGLLCTENREFLYDGEGLNVNASVNPNLLQDFGEDESNMAPSFEDSSPLTVETNSSSTISPSFLATPDGETPKKIRKRNAARDRLRSEAEQNAYKKLRELVPTLPALKKPTKLETIRHTCRYIERLQETLTKAEKQKEQRKTKNADTEVSENGETPLNTKNKSL
jgi:hypothetical protein